MRGAGWRFLGLIAVLFAIPWGIGLWLLEERFQARLAEDRARAREDLQQVMGHLLRISSPETFVSDQVARYRRALRWDGEAAARIGRGILPWARLYVFDAAGRRLMLPGTTAGFRAASEDCLQALQEGGEAARPGGKAGEARGAGPFGRDPGLGTKSPGPGAGGGGGEADRHEVGQTPLPPGMAARSGSFAPPPGADRQDVGRAPVRSGVTAPDPRFAPGDGGARSSRKGAVPAARVARSVEGLLGSSRVLETLRRSPGRLVNLLDLGIPRLAGWFPWPLGGRRRGTVLIVAELDALPPEVLAWQAIGRLHRLAGGKFGFSLGDAAGLMSPRMVDVAEPATAPGHSLVAQEEGGARRLPLRQGGVADIVPGGPAAPQGSAGGAPAGGAPPAALVRPFPADLQDVLNRRGETEREGRLYLGSDLEKRFVLGAFCPIRAQESWAAGRFWALAGATLGALGLLLGALRGLDRAGLPLRWQILGLFTLAAAGGVGLLLGLAGRFLDTRERAILRERRAQADAILMHLDGGFVDYRFQLEGQFHTLRRRLENRSRAEIIRLLPRALSPAWKPWMHVLLIDGAGRIPVHLRPAGISEPEGGFGARFESLFAEIGKWAVFAWQWRRDNPGGVMPMELDDEPATVRFAARNLVKEGAIAEFAVSGKRYPRLCGFLQDRDGEGYCLVAFLEREVHRRIYLRSRRRQWRQTGFPGAFSFELLGLPVEGAEFGRLPVELRRFQDVLTQAGAAQETVARIRGRDWVLVGRPGTALEGYNLILGFPLAPIQEESARLAMGFRLLAGILLVLALGLGTLFARVVLEPLQDLLTGLEHLAAGRWHRRLALATGDEFEPLAQGVNTLLDEMEQQEAAWEIRKQLEPGGAVTGGGLTVAGWSETGREFQGALFDQFPLDDGRIGACLACLPQRGLAGALLLAAVKTHVRVQLEGGGEDPVRVVAEIMVRFLAPGADAFTASPEAGTHLLVAVTDPAAGTVQAAWIGEFLACRHGATGRRAGPLRASGPPEEGIESGTARLAEGESLRIGTIGWEHPRRLFDIPVPGGMPSRSPEGRSDHPPAVRPERGDVFDLVGDEQGGPAPATAAEPAGPESGEPRLVLTFWRPAGGPLPGEGSPGSVAGRPLPGEGSPGSVAGRPRAGGGAA
ncbi:MAG: methyl-accepting chemotaxis protein [Candidatus Riflebacteria bacterium]|nr:methyl-accepting chemotaxis protein [Candidatus Riflebacteria bacterium]